MNWRQFWGLCEHKWVELEKLQIHKGRDNLWAGNMYSRQCKKCKIVKTKNISF